MYFALVAYCLTRQIHRWKAPSRKVIVVDCDNTLWQGVVGELGAFGVSFPPAFVALQRFVVGFQQRGMLLCLCSKNNEEDVLAVFRERASEMAIDLETHVVAYRINWQPKSRNIAELAESLKLGVDSFLFIDDSSMECAEVSAAHPAVQCVHLPPLAATGISALDAKEQTTNDNLDDLVRICTFLQHLWAFDVPLGARVTTEDLSRTDMYRTEQSRVAWRTTASSHSAFIASLNISISVEPIEAKHVLRVAQLTDRTNQFNPNKQVLSQQEVSELSNVFTVTVSDRFGYYGLVGAVAMHADLQSICIPPRADVADSKGASVPIEVKAMWMHIFVLSCRVLHRGVEHAMLRQAAETATGCGASHVVVEWRPSDRNQVAQAFFFQLDGWFIVSGCAPRRTADVSKDAASAQDRPPCGHIVFETSLLATLDVTFDPLAEYDDHGKMVRDEATASSHAVPLREHVLAAVAQPTVRALPPIHFSANKWSLHWRTYDSIAAAALAHGGAIERHIHEVAAQRAAIRQIDDHESVPSHQLCPRCVCIAHLVAAPIRSLDFMRSSGFCQNRRSHRSSCSR